VRSRDADADADGLLLVIGCFVSGIKATERRDERTSPGQGEEGGSSPWQHVPIAGA
jgi:hypothetical protein